LVDDELMFADAMSGFLTDFYDCEVRIAVDAAGAERLARDVELDVMLLDYHLPRVKGDVVVRRIREIAPRLPIFVVTGDTSPRVREACLAAGATEVVTKGQGLDAILRVLPLATR
jgi:DNA-binding NarL/FixJ family response regulator